MAGFFNRIVAAHYATRYAIHYNRGWLADEMDCTNFVSQALYAGGWTMTAGRGLLDPDTPGADPEDLAWYNTADADAERLGRTTLYRSRSWGAAENFRRYLQFARRARICNIDDLTFGDVVQHYVNGEAHHSMMITGMMPSKSANSGRILLASYHSKDKVNAPLILLNPPHKNLFWKILDVFPDTSSYIDPIIANSHERD